MEEKVKIIDISVDYETRKTKVTFLFENRGVNKFLEKYRDKLLKIIIKRDFKKRSLNANAYAWYLITELANVMKISKEKMYFLKLQDYGQSELVLITSEAKPENFFKYYKEEGETVVKSKKYKWYKVYKGTSEYDTKEMAIFINGLEKECEEQDISTKSKIEVKSLLEEWNDNN